MLVEARQRLDFLAATTPALALDIQVLVLAAPGTMADVTQFPHNAANLFNRLFENERHNLGRQVFLSVIFNTFGQLRILSDNGWPVTTSATIRTIQNLNIRDR